MIEHVALDLAPLTAGEAREITVWTDAAPVSVKIRCFVEYPPPPDYRTCAECGSFSIGSGEITTFTASQKVFATAEGFLVLEVIDAAQDERRFELRVEREKEPARATMR
jgi:hypothetical protein